MLVRGDEALVFAHSELDRLGLADLTVVSGPGGTGPARVSLDWKRLVAVVAANDQADIETLKGAASIAPSTSCGTAYERASRTSA